MPGPTRGDVPDGTTTKSVHILSHYTTGSETRWASASSLQVSSRWSAVRRLFEHLAALLCSASSALLSVELLQQPYQQNAAASCSRTVHVNSCSTLSPVSTNMGDHCGHTISHQSQLSLLPSAGLELSIGQSMVTLRLHSKGRYGSFHRRINRLARRRLASSAVIAEFLITAAVPRLQATDSDIYWKYCIYTESIKIWDIFDIFKNITIFSNSVYN